MIVVDDARLLQLAAHRAKDAFPILERAASLTPLVLVLTFLPGIVALQAATLSERDAQWRLKGLEVSTVPSIFDAVVDRIGRTVVFISVSVTHLIGKVCNEVRGTVIVDGSSRTSADSRASSSRGSIAKPSPDPVGPRPANFVCAGDVPGSRRAIRTPLRDRARGPTLIRDRWILL